MRIINQRLFFQTCCILLVTLLTVVAGLLRPANAQQSPIVNRTIAVTRWQPVGDEANQQAWLAESLQSLTAEDLSRIGEVTLMPVEEYRTALREAGIGSINPNESNNASRIREATGADLLFIGTYQVRGDRIRLSAVFYNPSNQETLASADELGPLGKIKSLETSLLKQLLRKVEVTLGSSEQNWLERDKTLQAPELEFTESEPRPDLFREEETTTWRRRDIDWTYRKSMSVGLHYPGASIGFRTSPYSSVEIRGSSNSDITVLGGRYNYRAYEFGDAGSSNLFVGAQVSHIDFVGEVSEGTGLLGGGYFGFEQYFTPYMSFRADFGSYFITLEDADTSLTESGLGFALNTGLAIHFL